MIRENFYFTEHEDSTLRFVSSQTGLSVSELVRRSVDYCLQGRVLNELVPGMSGYIAVHPPHNSY